MEGQVGGDDPSSTVTRRRRGFPRAAALVAFLPFLLPIPAARSADASPLIAPGVREGADRGPVRVLVELRLEPAWRPEGELDAGAAAAQRRVIDAAQTTVIARLEGTGALVVRRYPTAPWLALRIGAEALRALEGMGDVVSRVTLARMHRPAAAPPTAPPSRAPVRPLTAVSSKRPA